MESTEISIIHDPLAADKSDQVQAQPPVKGKEQFQLVTQQLLNHLKKQRIEQDASEKKETATISNSNEVVEETKELDFDKLMRQSIVGVVRISIEWIVDIVIATLHFSNGRYYTGALTLFFVFVGGAMVTLTLNVLMRRNGAHEFKSELKKIHPILLYLSYIPSLLPFSSAGMKIYAVRKIRQAKSRGDKQAQEKWTHHFKICEEHSVADLVYESSYEAYGQAILQAVIMVEKTNYATFSDYVPIMGIIINLLLITTTPIRLAGTITGVQVTRGGVIAALANKGVTLLSFTLFISAARSYYASDTNHVDTDLVLSTLLSILILLLFSEIPGIVTFKLELRQIKKRRETLLRRRWEIVVNLISLIIPPSALLFWLFAVPSRFQEEEDWVIAVCVIFGAGYFVAFIGFFAHKRFQWLGQFSTDALLLFVISLYSYFWEKEFREIGFHFDKKAASRWNHSQVEKRKQEFAKQQNIIETQSPQKEPTQPIDNSQINHI